MDGKGNILISRKILDWQYGDDNTMFAFWVKLILLANWKDGWRLGVKVGRGQLLTSSRTLAEQTFLSRPTVTNCLHRLEESGEITVENLGKKGALITILKYDDYQLKPTGKAASSGKKVDQSLYQSVDQSLYQSVDQSFIYKNNGNNSNKGNKYIISETSNSEEKAEGNFTSEKKNNNNKNGFIPPTIEDVENYIKEKDYSIDGKTFMAYYSANGWMVGKNHMVDWKASVDYWEMNPKKVKSETLPEYMIGQEKTKQDRNGQDQSDEDLEELKREIRRMQGKDGA